MVPCFEKWGGVLRIAVPDFEAVAQEYGKEHDLERLMGLLYGGQDYEYNYHYTAFDFGSLKKRLEDNGFVGVKRYDWREFLPDGFDDYSRSYIPHMDFDNGKLMSLNIVAVKDI